MTCRPLMESEPESGQSGCSAPVMILIRVDLPAPFSPTSAWTSPSRRSNETPLSARTAPNDLEIESTLRSIESRRVSTASGRYRVDCQASGALAQVIPPQRAQRIAEDNQKLFFLCAPLRPLRLTAPRRQSPY